MLMKEEMEWLAKLAYQGGEKALQRGWWDYVKGCAEQRGVSIDALVSHIKHMRDSETC